MSAIQALIEDLYVRGLFTGELSYRMHLLEGSVFERQFILTHIPVRELTEDVPYFLLFGFLGGSKTLATQLSSIGRALSQGLIALVKTRSVSRSFANLRSAVELRKILGPGFFDGYSVTRGIRTFVDIFGPYSFAQTYLYRGRSEYEELGHGKVLIYGLERLIVMEEL